MAHISFFRNAFVGAFFLLFFSNEKVSAQFYSNFETILVLAGTNYALQNDAIFTYWKPEYSILLGASTPYYKGILMGGLEITDMEAITTDQPDYTSLFLNLGWGKSIEIFNNSDAFLAGIIGSEIMLFDKAFDSDDTNTNEQEISLGIKTGINVRFFRNFLITTSFSHRKVYTYKRIYFSNISFGLLYEIKSSKPLNNIIK